MHLGFGEVPLPLLCGVLHVHVLGAFEEKVLQARAAATTVQSFGCPSQQQVFVARHVAICIVWHEHEGGVLAYLLHLAEVLAFLVRGSNGFMELLPRDSAAVLRLRQAAYSGHTLTIDPATCRNLDSSSVECLAFSCSFCFAELTPFCQACDRDYSDFEVGLERELKGACFTRLCIFSFQPRVCCRPLTT